MAMAQNSRTLILRPYMLFWVLNISFCFMCTLIKCIIEYKKKSLVEMAKMMFNEHMTPKKVLGQSDQHNMPCTQTWFSSSFLDQNL
jgi:hypothetical protein